MKKYVRLESTTHTDTCIGAISFSFSSNVGWHQHRAGPAHHVEVFSSKSSTKIKVPRPKRSNHRQNWHCDSDYKPRRPHRNSVSFTYVCNVFKLRTSRMTRTSGMTLNKKFALHVDIKNDYELRVNHFNRTSVTNLNYPPQNVIVKSRPTVDHTYLQHHPSVFNTTSLTTATRIGFHSRLYTSPRKL